jgi:hypothetical protein
MRVIPFCCVLLLLMGCDTMGGRTVVLKLQSQGQRSHKAPTTNTNDVPQILLLIDKIMAPEGVSRVARDPRDDRRIADYVGGPFICSVLLGDDELQVDFRNPHFGGGPPDSAVQRVSDELADGLKTQYGVKRVSIKH